MIRLNGIARFTVLLLAAGVAGKSLSVWAQEQPLEEQPRSGVVINLPPEPSIRAVAPIVVVDMERILDEAAAITQLRATLAAARQGFQLAMREREAQLQERDQVLAGQRDQLDPDVFQRERDQLARDLTGLQDEIKAWFREHDRVLNQALRQTQTALLAEVSALATERGAVVVLSKSSIVLVQPDLDITEAALRRLNEVLPALPPPAFLEASGAD
ncbi:MAG: OmpH family outer membrane protein [Pseudomonadota bacterium]